MLVILALSSAAFYGAADFLGGLASRRASAIAVVAAAQLSGLVALCVVLPLLPPSTPDRDDWIWGAAAGITGGVGVALLYRALAIGTMAIIAPITAVFAVIVPGAAAIAFGERPGTGAIAGIVLAILAIVLVSQQSASHADGVSRNAGTRGAGIAFVSGVAIGFFFLCLARTSADAGLMPLVANRAVSSVLFMILALIARRPLRMPQSIAAIAVAGGVLDMLANVLYLLATRYGPLSMAVTLASLYPASTVLLARMVLGERLSHWQAAGVACALAAVLLIVGSR